MKLTLKKIKLSELIKHYNKDKFYFNPHYQRSEVWEKGQKQMLIDSILKKYSIGMFFFKKDKSHIEVLDGQQRIKAIGEFVNNKFRTSREFSEDFFRKNYDDLKKDKVRWKKFQKFTGYYMEVANASDQIISDIFIRLQEGKSLNSAEKLNALRGEMRDFVAKTSEHPIFDKTGISSYRFGHRFLVAQIAKLEEECDFDSLYFQGTRFPGLKNFYESWQRKLPSGLSARIKKTLNFLAKSLGRDAKIIRDRGDFLPLYLLASNLCNNYITRGQKRHFNKFVKKFFSKVELIKDIQREYPKSLEPYNQYVVSRKGGLSTKNLRTRFEILNKQLFETRKFKLRARQRAFNISQKIIIFYSKDKEMCKFRGCGKKVAWEAAAFHHKKFHCDGGPTNIKNGQLMHRKCHIKYHKTHGPDITEE